MAENERVDAFGRPLYPWEAGRSVAQSAAEAPEAAEPEVDAEPELDFDDEDDE